MYQARAILWAQWKTLLNFNPASRRKGFWFPALIGLIWYGIWAFGAAGAAFFIAENPVSVLQRFLPGVLLLVLLYWQIIPILMVSSGMSLDIKRLLVYPIPHGQLFTIEVLLRVTNSVEMVIILCGVAVGIVRNPQIRWWGVLALAPFVVFNLALAAGLRDLLTRLFARKRIREAVVFLFVLIMALPQLLVSHGVPGPARQVFAISSKTWYPWAAAAKFATGEAGATVVLSLLGWAAIAWIFGRRQFEAGLRFDEAAVRASDERPGFAGSIAERFFRFAGTTFPDPLGGLVEKELRSLTRSARFRLTFLMGFSFGLLVWFPLAFRGDESGFVARNFLTVVSVYALMLLGEACFWNVFGFDRNAVQMYFVMPQNFSAVLLAKNIVAVFFVLMEITILALVCRLLRRPVTMDQVAEAFSVIVVFTVFLLAIGNMLSTKNPRPADPAQSWRNSSTGRVQALLLVIYPVAFGPIVLAYMARYAFDTQAAFYGVLAVDAMVAAIVYSVAMESAVNTAEHNREYMIAALSRREGPVAS